jgi:hypothetical protein
MDTSSDSTGGWRSDNNITSHWPFPHFVHRCRGTPPKFLVGSQMLVHRCCKPRYTILRVLPPTFVTYSYATNCSTLLRLP